jgi:hypothetical protein
MNEPVKSRRLPLIVAALFLLALCGATIVFGAFLLLRRPIAEPSTVLYVLDASQRMAMPAAGAGASRLEIAKNVLAEVIRPSDPGVVAGLRVFGSGAAAQGCQDTALLVSPAAATQGQIVTSLESLPAGANTDAPLSEALIAAIRDLKDRQGKAVLVVVTGGEDSCAAAAAAQLLSQEAAAAGIDLQTFVVGFQVEESSAQALRELVAALEDAYFLVATDAETLANILLTIQKLAEETATIADVLLSGGSGESSPEPTLRPTWTPTPPATAASAELTPVATGQPTPGPTFTPAASHVAQSACDHLYYPLRAGARWQSEHQNALSTAGAWAEVTEVSAISGDLLSATASLTTEGLETRQWELTCRDGSLFDENGDTFLPPAEALATGASWSATNEELLDYEIECQAGAAESVITPAGTFAAIRVDCLATWVVLGSTDSQAQSRWYAAGVGEVRRVWTTSPNGGGSFPGEFSLLAYEIPAGAP